VNLINDLADLGVFFDTKMNFKEHINKMKNKASLKLDLLKRSCSNYYSHFTIKKKYIYFSIVHFQF
jgi:hypothetical protein